MKLVAVSQRVDQVNDRDEFRDALDQRLAAFITLCGHLPLPVPNCLGRAICDWLSLVSPSAVVLSGGNDIGQCVVRDETERALLAYAIAHRLPLLGICRGMQMMACWFGSPLHEVNGHVRTRHSISGEITGHVNSYHAFSVVSCPEEFRVLARSEDGEIEAIRHRSLRFEGWMWHPEREIDVAKTDVRRFIKLLA